MKNISIVKRKAKLDNLFDMANTLPQGDLELLSNWAKYLCVLVSGFIEWSVKELYGSYPEGKADKKIGNYIKETMKWSRNMKMEQIIEIARRYSSDWGDELENIDDELTIAINSVVGNKNNIAHGKDSNITMHNIKDYYKKVIRVIEMIENQCNN